MWAVSGKRAYHIGSEMRHIHPRRLENVTRHSREIFTNWPEGSGVSEDTFINISALQSAHLSAFIILFLKGRFLLKRTHFSLLQTTPSEWNNYVSLTLFSWPGMSLPYVTYRVSPQQCRRRSVSSRLPPRLPHSLATWLWLSHLTFLHPYSRD